MWARMLCVIAVYCSFVNCPVSHFHLFSIVLFLSSRSPAKYFGGYPAHAVV